MKHKPLFTFALLLLLLNLVTIGCWRSETPPAPNMAGGGYENVGYEFFQWQEGLDIMLWHEAVSDSICDSQGATDADTHLVQCRALTESGIEFTWQIQTSDGRTAQFALDGQVFDLEEGNVFLVSTENDIVAIQQLERDLSAVDTTHDSITQFGLADPDISQFIQTAVPEN